MEYGTLVMFCVAGILGAIATGMFFRLRRPHSERAGYGYMMAATMLAAAAFMLGAYATALYSWSQT